MVMQKLRPNFILATLLSLMTSGCVLIEGSQNDASLTICPRAGVLYDASQLYVFGPDSDRSERNLAYDAEIADAQLTCKYDGDEVKSNITFNLDLWAGPAAPLGRQTFRYFVAVTELNTQVIQKDYYSVDVNFSRQNRVTLSRKVNNITVDYSNLGRADLYEILVGWDMTPEQAQYARSTSIFDRPNIKKSRDIQNLN